MVLELHGGCESKSYKSSNCKVLLKNIDHTARDVDVSYWNLLVSHSDRLDSLNHHKPWLQPTIGAGQKLISVESGKSM